MVEVEEKQLEWQLEEAVRVGRWEQWQLQVLCGRSRLKDRARLAPAMQD